MSETYDVTIDGTGYMVKPGAYQRFQDGQTEGRVGRVRLFDFYGGGKRAAQMERDRFWSGAGAWPTLDSQGVIAGPIETDRTLTVTPAVDPADKRWSFTYQGTTYVISGADLYSVDVSSGAFNGLTHVQTFEDTVVDACLVTSLIWVCYGAGTNASSYDLSDGTYAGSAGAEALFVGAESNAVLLITPDEPWYVYNQAGTTIEGRLDSPARRLVSVDGHLWVMTEKSVFRFTAIATNPTTEASTPQFGADDDYSWALAHFGRLWTWAGKEIIYYDTTDDSFKGSGIRGQATRGACTVGSWLVVVIDNLISGDPEMWAYDGRGWWLLEDGSTTYEYPVSIFGSCDDADMLAGRGSTSQHTATWQFFDRSGAPAIRDSFEIITALMDAGERDLDKVWRRAGVEIATPDDRATADSVTVTLSYSDDGGSTWTQVATQNLTS